MRWDIDNRFGWVNIFWGFVLNLRLGKIGRWDVRDGDMVNWFLLGFR